MNLLKNDTFMSLKSNEKHRKRLSGTPPLRSKMNNGFSTGEEDSRGPNDQVCCLIEDGESCRNAAGNASYSKRIQKTVTQRRLKLNIDPQVMCIVNFVMQHEFEVILVLFHRMVRLTTFTSATSTRHGFSVPERNDDVKTLRMTATKPTPTCPK